MGNETAEAFGRRTGHLCLPGLRRLSLRQAASLAAHHGELQVRALVIDDAIAECLGRHRGSLLVRVPTHVPVHRLAVLVAHQGPLEIVGLQELDEPRARVLAAQRGLGGRPGLSCLFLDDVTAITPASTAILATHAAGGLALPGLTELDEDVAREIVRHPLLALDRVRGVTDRVAEILAAHAGTTLSLRGLRQASPRALALLRESPSVELGPSA